MVKRYTLQDDFGPIDPCDDYVDDDGDFVLYGDYAALEAKVAELEKDAVRYRWIRENCDSLESSDLKASGWIYTNNGCTLLDELIDAIMSREA